MFRRKSFYWNLFARFERVFWHSGESLSLIFCMHWKTAFLFPLCSEQNSLTYFLQAFLLPFFWALLALQASENLSRFSFMHFRVAFLFPLNSEQNFTLSALQGLSLADKFPINKSTLRSKIPLQRSFIEFLPFLFSIGKGRRKIRGPF